MISAVNGAGTPAWIPEPIGPVAPAANPGVTSEAVDRTASGTLSLTTRDGDTVTISASLENSLTYGPDGSTGGNKLVLGSQRNLSVQVSGSLDPRELRDIRRIVRRFLHDLRSALRTGDPSVSNLAQVHARSLQSLTAEIDTSTQVTAA